MVTVIQFLLSLSLLVTLHELGHFMFARLFKTRVEKFYLFFDFLFPFSGLLNFSLWKKKKGDTEYGIGWFPLGGYVKIAGMVDESMDKDQLARPPQSWEFRSKKAWQRLLIMLGGIIMNVLTAIIIYAFILWTYGQQRLTMEEVNHRGGIQITDSFAYQLGFQNHDKILYIDNEKVEYFDKLHESLLHANTVIVERAGTQHTIQIPKDFIGQLVDKKAQMLFTFNFPPIVGKVVDSSSAKAADLQVKDVILAINNEPIHGFLEFRNELKAFKNQTITLTIQREGNLIDKEVNVSEQGTIGFMNISDINDLEVLGFIETEKYKFGFFESFPEAIRLSISKVTSYAQQFKLFLNPETDAYKGMGGFYSLGKIFGDDWDWEHFWNITAFLSIVLAFMNLLPIPGLDGGYVVFTLFEMLTGIKASDRVMEIANSIGLIFLLFLMIYANGNDIIRNFFMK